MISPKRIFSEIYPPISIKKNANDYQYLQDQKFGKIIQSPPILFNENGHVIYLNYYLKNSSCFFIGGGPSFNNLNKSFLDKAGILSWGVNNSVKTFRPNFWSGLDEPYKFMKSIWLDPKITKFVPFCHSEKTVFDNENWKNTNIKIKNCPNVFFFRRNDYFQAEQFLFEDTVNWGNSDELGGCRSVMLSSLRLMFYLGIRTVYLLGVDFQMDNNNKYHFEQNRSEKLININNNSYIKLIERFTILKPIFEKYNFQIYNCNKNSNLKVFEYIDYEKAIENSIKLLPKDLINERTSGLYEREDNKIIEYFI